MTTKTVCVFYTASIKISLLCWCGEGKTSKINVQRRRDHQSCQSLAIGALCRRRAFLWKCHPTQELRRCYTQNKKLVKDPVIQICTSGMPPQNSILASSKKYLTILPYHSYFWGTQLRKIFMQLTYLSELPWKTPKCGSFLHFTGTEL